MDFIRNAEGPNFILKNVVVVIFIGYTNVAPSLH